MSAFSDGQENVCHDTDQTSTQVPRAMYIRTGIGRINIWTQGRKGDIVTHRRNLHPHRNQMKMQYNTTQNVTSKGTGKK
jgi:hypothetical protein